VYAGDKLLSGTFEMSTQGGESAALTVREGKVGKVRTSKPVAYLGMVLYERGILDDQELNASLALVASQRALHGSILLDRGTVTRPQLIAALREQTLRKLAYMFGFAPDTTFTFHPDTDLLSSYGGNDVEPIDPLPSIWRGIREYPPEDHVRAFLDRVGERPCGFLKGAQPLRLELEEDARAAVDELHLHPMTVAELAATRSLGRRRAELLLYCLLITKQVEPVQAAVRAESLPPVQSMRVPPATSGTQMRAAARAHTEPPRARTSRPPRNRASTPAPSGKPAPSGRALGTNDLSAADPKNALTKARAFLEREDVASAEHLCSRVCRAEPDNVEALALLAWIQAMNPNNQSPEAVRKSIVMLTRAIDRDEDCENALFWRAQLYKRLENHPAAIRDFKRVVALNGENLDAIRELRIYEMRVRRNSITMPAVGAGARRSSSPSVKATKFRA
jgi:thioredoxin-like negative regulator of GroEL